MSLYIACGVRENMSQNNILKEWNFKEGIILQLKNEISIQVKCHFDRNSIRINQVESKKRVVFRVASKGDRSNLTHS